MKLDFSFDFNYFNYFNSMSPPVGTIAKLGTELKVQRNKSTAASYANDLQCDCKNTCNMYKTQKKTID